MGRITELLNSVRELELRDEDNNQLGIRYSHGVASEVLAQYEQSIGSRLPPDLRELLSYSNGISLFGLDIMSLDEMIYFPNQRLITIHNWGNGDFDCASLDGGLYTEGSIVFMNHRPEVTVLIDHTLYDWLQKVIAEIERQGALLHPADYKDREESGLYQDVVQRLEGVECELND